MPASPEHTRKTLALAAAVLFASSAVALAETHSADPRVPPGRDPGGRPVAIICNGIDYTKGNIANMLARDGEGEITGYDFADDDRRPFDKTGDTAAAEVLVSEGQTATLVVVRANLNDVVSLGKAIGYAAKSPAKIIAIPDQIVGPDLTLLIFAAAKRFPDRFFIRATATAIDADPADAQGVPANLIIVTSLDANGALKQEAKAEDASAELAISIATTLNGPNVVPQTVAEQQATAVARTAALAARITAVETQLSAHALKARIMALAKPLPATGNVAPRIGWIAEPQRHYWLE